MDVVNRFVRDQSGQDLLEYGLLIGLLAATIVATISFIGIKVHGFYTALENGMKAT